MGATLTVVGTGLQLGHMTIETASIIQQAEKLFYLVTDPVTEEWIKMNNATAESLETFYSERKERLDTYIAMTDRILEPLAEGQSVCAVFYGHPGVFVFPSHAAIRRARAMGFKARMLPGVSAEDCLFSDLGVDPGVTGCQSFEATDFLVNTRDYDRHSHLVIWQIGVIGDVGYKREYDRSKLKFLADRLARDYPRSHVVTIYEAARYVVCDPRIVQVELGELISAPISPISTLYVPPLGVKQADDAMIGTLGIPPSHIKRKAEAVRLGLAG